MADERESIARQYFEANGGLQQTNEEVKEIPKEEPKPEEAPTTEQPPVEADKKEPVAEEKKEEPVKTEEEIRKEQEKENNLKKALDEERAKRKRLREEKEALEAERVALQQKLKAYETPAPVVKEEEEEITDYDAALKALRAEQKALKSKVSAFELVEARREELAQQEAIIQERVRLEKMVESVHKELVEEGYAGFKRMAGEVTAELLELAKTDPEEARALDNPTGWKKIFKEKVYPDFHKELEETSRKRSLEDKKALKKEANLATSTGRAPQKKEEDDPNTWSEERKHQEYIKRRQALM